MYATLIVSKPTNSEKMRHTVVTNFDGDIITFTRLTNGKQGRGNAWQLGTPAFAEISRDDLWCEPIAIQITHRDALDLGEHGLPKTLLTKLVKCIPLDRQVETQVDNLFNEIYDLTTNDPSELAKYNKERTITIRKETVERMERAVGFVPTFEKVGHYIQRSWYGINEMAMYDFAHANGMNILFEGPAATGKTTSAEWYAMVKGWRYVSVQCSSELVASMLWGTHKQNPRTGIWEWQDGAVTDVWRNGGMLVIDEITAADPRTLMNLNSMLDDRKILVLQDNGNEVVEAHPDLIVVAAHNPHYRGTRPMNEALRDRFDIKLVFDYDYEIEKQIVKSESLLDLVKRMRKMSNPSFISPVTVSADNVAFESPISPRLMKAFEKIATGLSYELAVDIFVNNFNDEERSSVRDLLASQEYNLKSDLGLLTQTINVEEPSEA